MKQPQHDNLIIAANDKDALFNCEKYNWKNVTIKTVTAYPEYNWTHVKPAYKYQHVKDAYEADNSLLVQYRVEGTSSDWGDIIPEWDEGLEFRIKPKTITKRLYAGKHGFLIFKAEPFSSYTIPINGTDTEVECE